MSDALVNLVAYYQTALTSKYDPSVTYKSQTSTGKNIIQRPIFYSSHPTIIVE